MSTIDWTAFNSLPGSKHINFENLCRALIRVHFGQFGHFAALRNQPGVEFHLRLTKNCPALGEPSRWYGWQCKLYEQTKAKELKASSRNDIKDSLRTTKDHLQGLTDWVLWTPYTLSKKDQEWLKSLKVDFTIHQWAAEEVETYLNGPGEMLRSAYFGELVLTPQELEQRHQEAIQPIQERWLAPVHQSVGAERDIRRMLGEPTSWDQMITVGERLIKTADIMLSDHDIISAKLVETIGPFIKACYSFADTLTHLHEILSDGDLDIIQQKLSERKTLIDTRVKSILRQLRALNLSVSLDATNALGDMHIAQDMLNEIEDFLGVGLVAVIADAGGGKTQMAAQLTVPQKNRPAGILLHGRTFQKGQSLNDLSQHFLINGNPLTSMERLLASLDAAGKRSGCRLPLVIDGLNEAEDPRDWKAPLAILSETVSRHPNVLVVCTLRTGEHRRGDMMMVMQPPTNTRESFAVLALPDGVRTIESEGFGGDVEEAISKYFNFYRINAKDADIPVDFLQHPLNLRIFCEVTNPKRNAEVKVEYVPESLTLLFEKYVGNAIERIAQMTNLSYRYNLDEIEQAIYRFGLFLWEAKSRRVDEYNFRKDISDHNRSWDSSMVNLLSQEGIVFRNPVGEPGNYYITPVYDALGGYIVANSLLTKNLTDNNFNWFKEQDVIDTFAGENSHPLAYDTFNALVGLTPHRMYGRQLWKEVPDIFKQAALRFSIALDANLIDGETVSELMGVFIKNHEERLRLFPRLTRTRGVPDHPFNSDFHDAALRQLSVAERDLSWTEWVRENRSERYNELLAMENKWKSNTHARSATDLLRAKWVVWLLTSTDHELRDEATRALYWYGRGEPAALFDECIRSLEINDPYVPERMVAAGYGVAMANHVEMENQHFVNNILPNFARQLYDLMFAKEAPFSSTHIQLREFAYRTVELALSHNSSLLSKEEIKRSKPPFSDGGLRDWGQSGDLNKRRLGKESPFRMDFENYTIGRLVPGRGNYNFDHHDYQTLRAQILWRVEQLGWSSELFADVDSTIQRGQRVSRTDSNKKRIDRYGKKYSWIAYSEMSGLLHDQGVLENWRERTSSVDIDPSFPGSVKEGKIMTNDILGDPEMEMKDWILKGHLPEISQYLRLEEIYESAGPWVAMDGFITQQDERRGRKSFCFIRSFIVLRQDSEAFTELLSQQDLGGRWLPEKPEVIYTFAGEIPWCECFPEYGFNQLPFVTGRKTVKVQRPEYEYFLDGKRLDLDELDFKLFHIPAGMNDVDKDQKEHQWIIIKTFRGKGEKDKTREIDPDQIEVREKQVEVEEIEEETVIFNALIPVCDFGWEGYHSTTSEAGRAVTLAKEISIDQKLIGKPQTLDLYTVDGLQATFNISDRSDDYNNYQHMFFIKEDVLMDYLNKHNLSLVWVMWGEREYSSDQFDKLFHGSGHPDPPYSVFSFVERYQETR